MSRRRIRNRSTNDVTSAVAFEVPTVTPMFSANFQSNTETQIESTEPLSDSENSPRDSEIQSRDSFFQREEQSTSSNPGEPSHTFSEPSPTFSEPSPAFSESSPTFSESSPAFSEPSPTFSKTTPTFSEPSPTFSEPNDVQCGESPSIAESQKLNISFEPISVALFDPIVPLENGPLNPALINQSAYTNHNLNDQVVPYQMQVESYTGDIEVDKWDANNYDDIEQSFFSIDVCEGKIFKAMINMLVDSTKDNGSFMLSSEYITYSSINSEGTVLTEVKMRTVDFLNYELDSPRGIVGITCNMADLKKSIPKMASADHVCLSTHFNENDIYVANSTNNNEDHYLLLKCERANDIPIYKEVFQYNNSEQNPNVRVSCAKFSQICASIASIGSELIICRCYPRGFVFIPHTETDKRTHGLSRLGEVNRKVKTESGQEITTTDELLGQISISAKTLKYLAKVKDLNSNSIIKVYYEPDQALKLVCQIGGFGEWRAFVWSS